jgi:hypothetical protein
VVKKFECPYLKSEVELTDERELHIAAGHPEFLPEHLDKIQMVLCDPDQIRRSKRFPLARLFTRWFDDVRGGKYVVVIIVSDSAPSARHWIITGYVARKITEGDIEWVRH